MRDVQTKFPRGKVVRDRYVVEELLGRGGFATVYRVRDRRVKGNVFALKELIDPNERGRESFAFECEILKRLDHFALPRVYRVFEDSKNNRVYMLMDYIEGPNLEKLRQRQPEKRFSLSQIMQIMGPIIDAVTYLHTQQPPVIHRDIKPSNIIVPTAGDGAVLVDFGIAKEYDQDATTTAVRHCSPGYGAPEQYARGTNPRTDIYGLGATFYTLLTGIVPIDALYRMTWMGSKGTDPLEPANLLVSTVPMPVADVLQRAMAINSSDRFETVEELWLALKAPLAEKSVSVPVTDEVSSSDEQEILDASLSSVLPAATDATPPAIVEQLTPLALEFPDASLRQAAQIRPFLRGRSFVLFFTVLALIALFMGIVFGEGIIWPRVTHLSNSEPSAAVAMTSRSTPTIALSPSSVVPPSSTTVPTNYPALVQHYDGRIIDKDTMPPTEAGMSLSYIRQNETTIHGYFSVGPGLVGSGNFAGTVSTGNKIQFLVSGHDGLLPLFFEGYVQSNGSISGRYCSYQNNRCNYTGGGYGMWYVSQSVGWGESDRGGSPPTSGSGTFHAVLRKTSSFSSRETSLLKKTLGYDARQVKEFSVHISTPTSFFVE